MTKTSRARYTLEFKQEAVRLVENGQSIAAVARTLGVVDQTLFNWVKAHRQGKLTGADSKALVSAEQMEISRLRAPAAGTSCPAETASEAKKSASLLLTPQPPLHEGEKLTVGQARASTLSKAALWYTELAFET